MKKKLKVGLFGTCAGSLWRNEFIENLTIDFYNPVVENWTPECQEEEIKQRQECDFILYVLTPKMKGCYAVAELIQDSYMRPEKTIFCYLKEDGAISFGDHEIKSFNMIAKMVEENGAFYFLDTEDVINYLNTFAF